MAAATRRALFGGALAIATAGVVGPAMATPSDADTMRIVAEIDRMHAVLNSKPRTLSEEAWERLLDEAFDLEGLVLAAPCTSARVAAAQLRLGIPHMLTRGDREDRADDHMLRNVIAYLEARQ